MPQRVEKRRSHLARSGSLLNLNLELLPGLWNIDKFNSSCYSWTAIQNRVLYSERTSLKVKDFA
jgi:hypothetical protein